MKRFKKFLTFFLAASLLAGLLGVSVFVQADEEDCGHMLIQIEATDATCVANGNVEYWFCFVCGKIFSDKSATHKIDSVTIEAPGHKAEAVDPENDPSIINVLVNPTCATEGYGYVIIHCEVCHEELEHVYTSIPKLPHTPGKPIRENAMDPNCSEEGSHDELVYCTDCGELISRSENVSVSKKEHTPGQPVRENTVKPSCTEPGSYDEAVYCAVCSEELSRETRTVPATGHAGALRIENVVPATCTKPGSHDEVEYCTVCKEVLNRVKRIDRVASHTVGASVREKDLDPTCEGNGGYDTVWYCTGCNEELARTHRTVMATGHQHTEVRGYVAATYITEGRTGETWCTDCNKMIKSSEVIPCDPNFVGTANLSGMTATVTWSVPLTTDVTDDADVVPNGVELANGDTETTVTVSSDSQYPDTVTAVTDPGDPTFTDVDDTLPVESETIPETPEADSVAGDQAKPEKEPTTVNQGAGYFSAYPDVTTRTNQNLTRAEAAVILARASKDFDETATYTTRLSGVANHWASNYIGFVSGKGIVIGNPDGTYNPEGGLTRAELAVMVARFTGIKPIDGDAFADTNGHWAARYIAALKAAGILTGDSGNFSPDAPINRAEAVTIINRALDRMPAVA